MTSDVVYELSGTLTPPTALLLTAAASALFEEGERIMADAKTHYVPVDQGILRGSGHVQPPAIEGGDVSVQLVFGGPAEAYAIVQHENLTFHHTVGGAKYLELPLLAAESGMGERLAASIAQKMGGA